MISWPFQTVEAAASLGDFFEGFTSPPALKTGWTTTVLYPISETFVSLGSKGKQISPVQSPPQWQKCSQHFLTFITCFFWKTSPHYGELRKSEEATYREKQNQTFNSFWSDIFLDAVLQCLTPHCLSQDNSTSDYTAIISLIYNNSHLMLQMPLWSFCFQ